MSRSIEIPAISVGKRPESIVLIYGAGQVEVVTEGGNIDGPSCASVVLDAESPEFDRLIAALQQMRRYAKRGEW
jgi:hypothetical protein